MKESCCVSAAINRPKRDRGTAGLATRDSPRSYSALLEQSTREGKATAASESWGFTAVKPCTAAGHLHSALFDLEFPGFGGVRWWQLLATLHNTLINDKKPHTQKASVHPLHTQPPTQPLTSSASRVATSSWVKTRLYQLSASYYIHSVLPLNNCNLKEVGFFFFPLIQQWGFAARHLPQRTNRLHRLSEAALTQLPPTAQTAGCAKSIWRRQLPSLVC